MGKSKFIMTRVIIIAVFTALCTALTHVQVKMPTGDMVHLGNFVMIMSALLLGGIEGGLVGSLGMGIYDLIYYSSKPSTIIRTFILKFLIGFIVGFVFRLILKKKLNTTKLLIGATSFFGLLFVFSLILFLIGDRSDLTFKTGLLAYVSNFLGSGKTVKVSLYIPIFSFLFALGMTLAVIFSSKMTERRKAALFAITLAILVNILGEFLLRWLLEGIFNTYVSEISNGFSVSLVTATSKIPGSLITGFISVILAIAIYEPVYLGVKNLPQFKKNNKLEDREEEKEETTESSVQISEDNNNTNELSHQN